MDIVVKHSEYLYINENAVSFIKICCWEWAHNGTRQKSISTSSLLAAVYFVIVINK